jgi:hypothetical protein
MILTSPFILGVLSSIAATIILALAAVIWAKTRPWMGSVLFLRLTRTGIDRVFQNRESAERHLLIETRDSTTLRLLTNRGVLFADPAYGDTALTTWRNLRTAQVLLLDPDSESAARCAAEIRAITTTHASWTLEHFKADIAGVASKLIAMSHVKLRFHSAPSVFRLVITDDYARTCPGFLRKRLERTSLCTE